MRPLDVSAHNGHCGGYRYSGPVLKIDPEPSLALGVTSDRLGMALRLTPRPPTSRADGLIVEQNGTTSPHLRFIIQFAAKSRVPAAAGSRAFTEDGGLMSYGPNVPADFRRAATYADKILKTAKTLGLTIPQSMLARADQVIQ